jgi:hypothetical protein
LIHGFVFEKGTQRFAIGSPYQFFAEISIGTMQAVAGNVLLEAHAVFGQRTI